MLARLVIRVFHKHTKLAVIASDALLCKNKKTNQQQNVRPVSTEPGNSATDSSVKFEKDLCRIKQDTHEIIAYVHMPYPDLLGIGQNIITAINIITCDTGQT